MDGDAVSGDGGWTAHPDGGAPDAPLGPVPPGRVVGLGALCKMGPPRPDQENTHSFDVSEFLLVDDGRRVTLHRDRGFTIGGIRTAGVPGSLGPADAPASGGPGLGRPERRASRR